MEWWNDGSIPDTQYSITPGYYIRAINRLTSCSRFN